MGSYVPILHKISFEPRHKKTNVLVSDPARHKPGCTATEDSQRLEISDLESRGILVAAHLRSFFEKVGSLPRVFIVYICAHTFPR